MKIKTLLVFTAIFTFASISLAQTLVIKPQKKVYTRKGEVSSKDKRTFTVTYPLFNGTMPVAVKKKLENTISYWRVFDTTLAENLSETDWLYDLSYKVNYNKGGILDISLTQEGSGAYPDAQTYNFVIDLKTGEQVKFADVFNAGKAAEFAKMVDKSLKVEIGETIKQMDKGEFGDDKEANESFKEQLNALEFTAETFNEFSVNDKGVTILYDAGFPHVSQALQPDGRYFFTWAQVKPFVKTGGLLGKFVK